MENAHDKGRFFRMVRDRFQINPDYPFAGDFINAVFRRKDNLKWFAIVMTVAAKKLGIGAFGELDIVNLKCTDEQEDFDTQLIDLVDKSYSLVASSKKSAAKRKKE